MGHDEMVERIKEALETANDFTLEQILDFLQEEE